ncbi:prepilin-type N-terminal cleavage/methylation domain-containing protein [Thalassomonas sp. RHCl1]|uniref:prepilin-type N-terminal cleavage/methylation domain-containing protein n=1 Tax=Thalassomonas sp. RHCl1 TaxID=2995320 RepID=UPI00248AA902|nr:prepilin-type N-terminal cleavage/methylation domain-containing protein [Thalassomonas sp. RHCl1]
MSDRQRKRSQGFTLIELLIVTSILSMLMFVGTYSYSLFTGKWQEDIGQFALVNREASNFQRLDIILSNIMPFVVRKDDEQPGFFFIGGKESLFAITHDGLFSQASAEAFRLSAVKREDDKYALIYQAKPLHALTINTASQSIDFSDKITLFDGLDKIEFQYFGWTSFVERSGANTGKNASKPQWFTIFSGLDNQTFPEKLTLSLYREEKQIDFLIALDTDVARWLSPYFNEEAL